MTGFPPSPPGNPDRVPGLGARLAKRNELVMVTTIFVVYTGFAFVIPFLPLYVRQLGVVDEEQVALWAGILIGIAPLLAGLMAPVWGRLGDRHGQKRILALALAVYVVALLVSAVVRSVHELLLARLVVGVFGGIGALALAMAVATSARELAGKAIGTMQSAQIAAAAIGPFAGGVLADQIGIRATFVVAAALCAAALLLMWCGYREVDDAAGGSELPPPLSFRQILRLPGLVGLLVVLFFVNFIGRSFTPILPLYLQALGVAPDRLGQHTGMLISCYSVAAALSAALLGRASRRRPPEALLSSSLIGGAVTVLPMAFAPGFGVMLVCAVLLGLASGGALTLCYTIGGRRVPDDRRATAFGFFSSAALFGGAVSPTVAGLLTHLDLRAIFYVDSALFALLAAGRWPASRSASRRPSE
jgi:MFS transporter, DHA1 family, multidrug resistance protein